MIASAPASYKIRALQKSCVVIAMLALVGCSTTSKDKMTTGSVPKVSTPADELNTADLASRTAALGKAYDANPKDRNIGVNYANALRASGRDAQSLAVMQQIAIANPNDRGVLAAYGKAQAAAGQLDMALATIGRAQTPDRPDWRLVSAQGAILDQMGRNDEARQLYTQALLIAPEEASVEANFGLSYAMTNDLTSAEQHLRRAVSMRGATSQIRQNLALVLGLQGRFDECKAIYAAELPPEQVESNMAYVRALLTQQNRWDMIENG